MVKDHCLVGGITVGNFSVSLFFFSGTVNFPERAIIKMKKKKKFLNIG